MLPASQEAATRCLMNSQNDDDVSLVTNAIKVEVKGGHVGGQQVLYLLTAVMLLTAVVFALVPRGNERTRWRPGSGCHLLSWARGDETLW